MAKSPVRVALHISWMFALSSAIFLAQSPLASPPEPPVITAMNFDRLAIGDELVLTGTGFKPDSDVPIPALVTFTQNVQVSVVAESDTIIRLTVPNGAKAGPVTATITAVVEETTHTQISNTANLLVIFKNTPLGIAYLRSVLPGDEDNFHAVTYYPYSGSPTEQVATWLVKATGSKVQQSSFYYDRYSYSQPNRYQYFTMSTARNPANKRIYSLYYDNCTAWDSRCTPRRITWQIRDLATMAPLLSMVTYYSNQNCTAEYSPKAFGFDAEGNLLIAAAREGCNSALSSTDEVAVPNEEGRWSQEEALTPQGLAELAASSPGVFNFWRFPAESLNGQTVVLDPSAALMLTPGQFLVSYNLDPSHFNLAVAPDGSALFRFADCSGACEERFWIVPSESDSYPPRDLGFALPPPPPPFRFNEFISGYSTVDCMGRFYTVHDLYDPVTGNDSLVKSPPSHPTCAY